MTKKNIRPQQTAPVQRQTTAATSSLSPVVVGVAGVAPASVTFEYGRWDPFAGDDAE